MIRLLIYPLLFLLFVSCKQWHLAQHQNEFKRILAHSESDSSLTKLYLPYKAQLDSQMNTVIGYLETPLEKNQPESTLGNHISDIILKMSSIYTKEQVDISVVNFGGLRIDNLPEGNLTVEHAYQIMPFDNFLVTIKLKGDIIKKFFDLMAFAGGWPISGASYEIRNQKAENITIQGSPFDFEKEYNVALSDYLVNGGDNCTFLEKIPYNNTQVYFRDAIIEYWKRKQSDNQSISVFLEDRVKKINE